jgi:hypothetical protein
LPPGAQRAVQFGDRSTCLSAVGVAQASKVAMRLGVEVALENVLVIFVVLVFVKLVFIVLVVVAPVLVSLVLVPLVIFLLVDGSVRHFQVEDFQHSESTNLEPLIIGEGIQSGEAQLRERELGDLPVSRISGNSGKAQNGSEREQRLHYSLHSGCLLWREISCAWERQIIASQKAPARWVTTFVPV